MFQSLSGQKVVIIGINSGVDLAIAKKTTELGASVVLSHYSQDKLSEAMESLSGEIEAKTVDILNEDSVNAFFEQIGNFDHLIVTSMGDRNMPPLTLSRDEHRNGSRCDAEILGDILCCTCITQKYSH